MYHRCRWKPERCENSCVSAKTSSKLLMMSSNASQLIFEQWLHRRSDLCTRVCTLLCSSPFYRDGPPETRFACDELCEYLAMVSGASVGTDASPGSTPLLQAVVLLTKLSLDFEKLRVSVIVRWSRCPDTPENRENLRVATEYAVIAECISVLRRMICSGTLSSPRLPI